MTELEATHGLSLANTLKMRKRPVLQLVVVSGLVLMAGAVGLLVSGGFGSTSTKGSELAGRGATLFVAPDGKDGNACTQSAPCASFDRAYRVAAPGSTVVVTCAGSSCSYPDQTILNSSAKPLSSKCRWGAGFQDGAVAQDLSGCIHFRPDAAKQVTLKNVSINAPYVYLDGFTLAGTRGTDGQIRIYNTPGGGPCLVPNTYTDIIVRNVQAYNFFMWGVAYLSFVDDVFDAQYALPNTMHECSQTPHPYDNNHILFEGVTVKNVYYNALGQHIECLHVWNFDQFVLSGSKFLNCGTYDVSFDGDRGNLNHLTAFNDIFDDPCSHQFFAQGCNGPTSSSSHAVNIGCSNPNFTAAHNHFSYSSFGEHEWPVASNYYGCTSDITTSASVMEGPQDQYQCNGSLFNIMLYDHNVFNTNQTSPTQCGATNSVGNPVSSLYTDAANYDYSLRRGSPAIGFVPKSRPRPPVDINGDRRPPGFNADAGADQWDSARIVLGRSIGRIRIGGRVKDILAFYGKTRSRTKLAVNGRRLDHLAFSLHRGTLWAMADRGVVVGIGTTTPYYATTRGMGVNAPVTTLGPLRRLRWVECRGSLMRNIGGVGVFVKPMGGRRGSRIATVSMVKSTYRYGSCSR